MSTPAGNAGKLGFSPALAGKAGILFLGLIISNGSIRRRVVILRNRNKEEKIVQYHVGQAFFHQVNPQLETSQCFARVVR